MSWLFKGKTADEVWQQMAASFREREGWKKQNSRLGPTRELSHVMLTIESPVQRWATSRNPVLNPAYALAEVVWIMSGSNESRFLNAFFPNLPKFQGDGPRYHGAYGYRLKNQFGFDQIIRAYQALKFNLESRQVVLQIWDPNADFPDSEGRPLSPDIPCNVVATLKIRENRLDWMQVVRSNDMWRGLPYNIVQFTSVQEVLAGWLGMDVGAYSQVSDSLHVYDSDADNVMISDLPLVVTNSDSLALPKEESEAAFEQIRERISMIIDSTLNSAEILYLANWPEGPRAFQNILFVMAAELARRKNFLDICQELMGQCNNSIYKQLWGRWFERNHLCHANKLSSAS